MSTEMHGELKHLSVDLLIPTKDNPRRMKRDKSFLELVESVKALGVLQPVICRPHRLKVYEGKFDLRAGHRRHAAARDAGLKTIPCIVREMDDQTAMEVTVAENLQRENLHPLEEARGIQSLLDVGWDRQHIADRLGKTPAWVAKRAKLLELTPKWQKVIEDSTKGVSMWGASLLECVAPLSPATQDLLLGDVSDDGQVGHSQRGPLPTVAELNKYLAEQYLRTLAAAPFKLDDATLVPKAGACTNCPKRSSCEPVLFAEMVEEKKGKVAADRCLDLACYKAKCDTFAQQKLDELKREHKEVVPILQGLDYHEEAAAKKKFKGATNSYNMRECKPGDKGAKPAVIVAGKGVGKTTWVQSFADAHSIPGSKKGGKSTGQPTPLAERRKALASRRHMHVIEAIRELLQGETEKPGPIVEHLAHEYVTAAIAATFGTEHNRSDDISVEVNGKEMDPWKALKHLDNSPVEAEREVVIQVLPVLRSRIQSHNGDAATANYPEAERIADFCGIKFKQLVIQAATEIPEPKGWANLNADGTPKGEKKKPAKPKKPKGGAPCPKS